MDTTKEHENDGQAIAGHGRSVAKKRRVFVAVVATAVLLLSLIIIWTRRDSNVNSILSRAGFARLPESAKDVMMDRKGDVLDDLRVTFIRFAASQDEIIAFLQDSGISDPGSPPGEGSGIVPTGGSAGDLRPMLRRVLRPGPQLIACPSWWIEDWQSPGLLQYRREADRHDQTIITDSVTNTVYIQLYHP